MASSTAFLKNALERARRALLMLVLVPAFALAAEIEIVKPQLQSGEDGFALSADFKFDLGPRLEEAVNKGLTLYFVAEFELTRGRWYWFDEKLASRSVTYRLYYHALTRQYRLSTGGLHQSFETLSDAMRVLSRLRNWTVIDAGEKFVRNGGTYQAALRLYLDINQLPRPFQLTALGSKEWNLDSEWKVWTASITPPATVENK